MALSRYGLSLLAAFFSMLPDPWCELPYFSGVFSLVSATCGRLFIIFMPILCSFTPRLKLFFETWGGRTKKPPEGDFYPQKALKEEIQNLSSI